MSLPLPDPPQSLWRETYGPYTPGPSLEGDQRVDVAVIGGGFTGLTTAYELRRADPALSVAVLEARDIGYGSSGRNGSFAMTVVGLGFSATAMLRGRDYLARAHRYMMRAVDELDDLIRRERLDCERIRPGFLRVATTAAYAKKLRREVVLMNGLGFDDIHWLDERETRSRVDSPVHLGALWEPRLVLLHPLKLVRAEKELAIRYGARVYENSPVTRVRRGREFRIETPGGTVTAAKVVFATNAYSHLFPWLRRKQVPAFTYMQATEPLTPEQLAPIGWAGREGIEDARNLIHFYRLTTDNRIAIGAGPVGFTWGNSLDADASETAWREQASHLRLTFPHLKRIRFTHRWGGPFSVTLDLNPALGHLGDERAVYSLGCIGHGVSMSHLNAQTLRDLILERETELTGGPFVRRRVLPWPPEPLRSALGHTLRTYLRLEDWVKERELRRMKRQIHADEPEREPASV
ncbi:MAG TPA: FAD-binding oxidoreductase [Longimicrobiales bacterium]|nr:FAD-binding oxidoreductase [Longimicrobiales bacterium]